MLTLLTAHKGIDLHAATAARVMCERLDGGERLRALRRAEVHLLWGEGGGDWVRRRTDELLDGARRYNPNKHHYGVFALAGAPEPWPERRRRGEPLPAGWPGEPVRSDLAPLELADRLLGGPPPADETAVDVCVFPLGAPAAPLGGVVWRLVLAAAPDEAAALAGRLAVARGGGRGLLLNPHMEDWLVSQPRGRTVR